MDIPPISLPPGVNPLWQDLASFQDFMAQFHETLTDPAQKAAFGDLLSQLQQARTEAESVVPKVVQEMKAKAEGAQAEADGLVNEFTRLQQELQEKLDAAQRAQQPSGPLPTPEPAVDPKLSRTHAEEIVAAFGKRLPPTHREIESGSVWSHFDAIDAAPAAVPEPPPPILPHRDPPPPTRHKTIVPSSNDANLWSHLDDESADAPKPPPPRDEMDQSEKGLD